MSEISDLLQLIQTSWYPVL